MAIEPPIAIPKYLSFREAADILPSLPNASTVWRWAVQGLHGVKLQTVQFGCQRFTTAEWINEFGAALAAASRTPAQPTPAPRPTPARRRQEQRAALEELARS